MPFTPQWPLAAVYPVSCGFFWLMYLFILPAAFHNYVHRYGYWVRINQMLLRQNSCALVHTLVVVIGLTTVLACYGHELREAGLRPYYSVFAYIDVCISLGYMSFVLPWSIYVYFWLKERKSGTTLAMVVHHAAVVLAEVAYLLTQTSPWYGALALALFEVSNCFFVPYLLMNQLSYRGTWKVVCGFGMVVAFTFCRIVGCSVLGFVFVADVAGSSDEASFGAVDWLAVAASLLAFWTLLLLSWKWFLFEVIPATHVEFKMIFGPCYSSKVEAVERCWTGSRSESSQPGRAVPKGKTSPSELQAAA